MKKSFLVLLLIVFYACDNDIDINDDWRDIPVVYAVFDSGSKIDGDGSNFVFADIQAPLGLYDDLFDSDGNVDDINLTHFVRVQKSFLGPLSADNYVDEYDSIYYNPSHISVWIDLVENGEVVNVDPEYLEFYLANQLCEDHSLFKEDGDFNADNHYLFKLPEDISNLCQGDCEDMSRNYRVSVLNNVTGEIASSETNIVEPINIVRPKATGSTSVLELGGDYPIEIKIYPSKNAKMYSVKLIFNYLEQTKNGYNIDKEQNGLGEVSFIPSTEVVKKSIEWTLLTEVIEDIDQLNGSSLGNNILTSINPQAFFTQLKSQLLEQDLNDPDYYRYPLYSFFQDNGETSDGIEAGAYHRCIDIEIVAVNTELYTYLNANLPNYGINQERPGYNNVNNGIGHVSSKSTLVLSNLRIDNASFSSFKLVKFFNAFFNFFLLCENAPFTTFTK